MRGLVDVISDAHVARVRPGSVDAMRSRVSASDVRVSSLNTQEQDPRCAVTTSVAHEVRMEVLLRCACTGVVKGADAHRSW